MLPGIDDGAPDLETALAMARLAAADGIAITACTPHITPGVYDNTGPMILRAIEALQRSLDEAGIVLTLTSGADAHLAPDLGAGLRDGRVPSLGGSRYFLFEPPHHVAPPRLESAALDLLEDGHVPVFTHPERLTWIEDHYATVKRMAEAGVWMQVTGGSVTGRFGKRARYWAERMLDEGIVDILASDGHDLRRRPPVLSEARDAVAARLGEAEATRMVSTRPAEILADAPTAMRASRGRDKAASRTRGLMARLFSS
jgi:protein-tyrosine phosphatase